MTMTNNRRLLSLDALRGFDMFFIMGGSGLLIALAKLWPNPVTEWLSSQMHHVAWDGFAIMDMIFPLFLFIAGVSFPFSITKSRSKGLSDRQIHLKIFSRMLILIAFGLVYNGFFKLELASLRWPSVLARIGVAWAVAALLYMHCGFTARYRIAALALIGYWLISALIPAPDVLDAAPFSREGNLVGYIDRLLIPGHTYYADFDPEGILSTIPAIVTAMLGMFTGEIVFKAGSKKQMQRATLVITLVAIGLILVALLWSMRCPINKKLWSSSYVCFVGGISMLLFALFYYIIDVCGHQKWSFFFRVIGLNSITIYMLQRIVDFGAISRFFSNGLVAIAPESLKGLISSIFYIGISWLILYFFYRKKIFLKV